MVPKLSERACLTNVPLDMFPIVYNITGILLYAQWGSASLPLPEPVYQVYENPNLMNWESSPYIIFFLGNWAFLGMPRGFGMPVSPNMAIFTAAKKRREGIGTKKKIFIFCTPEGSVHALIKNRGRNAGFRTFRQCWHANFNEPPVLTVSFSRVRGNPSVFVRRLTHVWHKV